jgi:hypothetical protein
VARLVRTTYQGDKRHRGIATTVSGEEKTVAALFKSFGDFRQCGQSTNCFCGFSYGGYLVSQACLFGGVYFPISAEWKIGLCCLGCDGCGGCFWCNGLLLGLRLVVADVGGTLIATLLLTLLVGLPRLTGLGKNGSGKTGRYRSAWRSCGSIWHDRVIGSITQGLPASATDPQKQSENQSFFQAT